MNRFFSKIVPDPNTGCWLWTAAVTSRGYGRFRFNNGHKSAHRMSWFIHHGVWPSNLILHKCDTPACVNPSHLFEGNHKDNIRDMISKGRKKLGAPTRGELSGMAKLTEKDVFEIRNSNLSQRTLAKIYNVSRTAIKDARSGRRWGHLK